MCVCVCVCVCLYKNCRQPNFQARKLPVQNRRNCVRFQKLHLSYKKNLSYKKSCVPFFVQIYIYVNNKSKSALGLQLKSMQRYNKKSSWPADKHDFFRPQTKRRRKTRAQKQNCEPSRTELRGLAIFDARARNLRFRPP